MVPTIFHDGANSTNPKLNVTSLSKTFAGRGNILTDVSFTIADGEAVVLIGGNGSGKSTLLRCCLRLIEPDAGKIRFLSEDIVSLDRKMLRQLRSQIGLVFQKHNLVPRLSALTNVIHGAMGREWGLFTLLQGMAPRHLRDEAMECLDKVGVAHLAKSRADTLSGGESQRVAIARALMQRPKFMIADEPVASLDPKVGREVMELFMNLNETESITFLYVSHDLDHALDYSHRLLGLQKGKLVLSGETARFDKGDLNEVYH